MTVICHVPSHLGSWQWKPFAVGSEDLWRGREMDSERGGAELGGFTR